ncbi:MAG TPA: sodium:proton antiporter [Clostridiales bacterium]|jgi:Na+/H+ antiporter NhaD/arsenite permease-like protein|nr:sodium:proton antiporter [Clostridiales bacterium]
MHEQLGNLLPLWSVLPFVGMLLSLALFPLLKPDWWEHHRFKVSLFWSAVFFIPFVIGFGIETAGIKLAEMILLDYVPFIVLLFGLFVVAGGIVLKGTLVGTTKVNLALLLVGTALASWIGTTGAAMLMIRPVIRANAWREKKSFIIIFFIFLVANMGGCLTPLGDPPLFLGFLRGIPFLWTMRLFPPMIFNVVILCIVYVIIDRHFYKKEIAAGRSPDMMKSNVKEPLRIEGGHNLIFILMIITAVILNGTIPNIPSLLEADGTVVGFYLFPEIKITLNYLLQIGIILLAAFLSLKTTAKSTRELNAFTFGPIKEVAELFLGIFITMIPALAILMARGADLGLDQAWEFFWATGALSSFLDNAPTYLVFMTTAASLGTTSGVVTTVGTISHIHLLAVSAGAVFMGANTYIGNAPNFMVKSIAEENKIKMPSFFGYMGWSLVFLIPLFVLDTFIFFL